MQVDVRECYVFWGWGLVGGDGRVAAVGSVVLLCCSVLGQGVENVLGRVGLQVVEGLGI
jgi:hypothetical protein